MDLLGLRWKSGELARFYKQSVLNSSFLEAVDVVLDEDEIGDVKELVDCSGDAMSIGRSIIVLDANEFDKIHFARDGNGVFAVIKYNMYRPIIGTASDKRNLRNAEKYERCERSTLRRIWCAYDILIDYHLFYPILKPLNEIRDILYSMSLIIKQERKKIEEAD
jgi:hypothetical protein